MKKNVITSAPLSNILLFLISTITHSMAYGQSTFDDDEDALLGLYGDEEMISIAIGDMQLISKAPAVASVITNENIGSMGANDLDEILETIPGLHISYNPTAYTPIYTFRGIRSTHNAEVLMLVNGFPITNLFHGDRNLLWGGMPTQSIERIEIIRGPGSAVYGADAFSGVINIITKGGEDIAESTIGAGIGSFSSKRFWASSSSELAGFNIGLTVEYHDTEGDDSIIESDAQTFYDSILGTNASLAPGELSLSLEALDIRLDIKKERWRARAGLQQRSNAGIGVGAAEALDPTARYSSKRVNWDLTYHNADSFTGWDITSEVAYFSANQVNEKSLHLFPAGTTIFGPVYPNGIIGNPDVWEKNYRFNSSALYTGFASHKFRFGIGYHYAEIFKTEETKNFGINPETNLPLAPNSPAVDVSDTPYIFLPEENRENYHAFLQYIWQLGDDWEVTLGDRYDHYSDFGSTSNPRAAVVWSASQKLTIKALYGKAFRAPAFAELFSINNPITIGNPDLGPERIENYELVFDYAHSDNIHLTFNGFSYFWKDKIEFVPITGGYKAENIGKQEGKGLEAEINWTISDSIKVNGNYSQIRAIDTSANEITWGSPQKQLYLNIHWEIFETLNFDIRTTKVMERERVKLDPRSDLPDYTKTDLSLRYQQQHWGAGLKITNIFNSDLREPTIYNPLGTSIPNDLPLPGRQFAVEINTTF